MCYDGLLSLFTEMSKSIFGPNLLGVYLHGSAAMGCFNPDQSDLDLILIVDHAPSHVEKLKFMRQVVKLNEKAPPKGLELSIVKKEYCDPFIYPTPYELHFSPTHLHWFQTAPEDYVSRMHGLDKDLAAHFTIINHCGIVLCGTPIPEMFGEIPRENYLDSIWYDIENAAEDILVDPVYVTLNLCRVQAYVQEGLILSKKAGGEWGQQHLPKKFHHLIYEALTCYLGTEQMNPENTIAVEFAEDMLQSLKSISNIVH